MGLLARIFRLVWGGDVDRALRPVLAVGLAGSIAGSSAYPFLGIWAIKHLHAGQSRLAFAYLFGAILSGIVGYIAGHWSDKVGRRPMILLGWSLQVLVPVGLLVVAGHVYVGLALLTLLPVVGSLGGAADQAMVADLVAPERQEAAYAMVRVAQNLGVTIGPVIGGVLLVGGRWPHLWIGTLTLGLIAASIAFRYIPRRGAYAPEGPPERGSLRVILRDRPFMLFMLFGLFASMTYLVTETLLPISATTSHHLNPAVWGFVMILNPLLVTVFQLRVMAWTKHVAPPVKLGTAMLLMSVPFLLIALHGSVGVLAVVVIVFVIGEMLWIPTAQAVVAALAPADIRGAYMGAYGGTWSIAWALTPFLGLEVRHAYGDTTMWFCVACLGAVAAVLGVIAARGRGAEAAVASLA